jgi:uncharacterized protein YuzE
MISLMRLSYNRKDDILTYELTTGNVDHAEEFGPMIFHLDKKGKPIILEILDASEFLSASTKITMRIKDSEKVEL